MARPERGRPGSRGHIGAMAIWRHNFLFGLIWGGTRLGSAHLPSLGWVARGHAWRRRLLGLQSKTPWPAPIAVGQARADILAAWRV
jgi:hypothetical protein